MLFADIPLDDVKYLLIFRGIERLLLVGAGITAIICGAWLFKQGVFDKFEAAVEKSDLKVKVMSTVPGTVFAIAGIVLCSIGYFYGIRDLSVGGDGTSPKPAANAGPNVPPGPAPGPKMKLGAYSSDAIKLLDRFIKDLKEALPEDEAKAQRIKQGRRATASYLSGAYQDQLVDLRELQKLPATETMKASLEARVARVEKVKGFYDSAMSMSAEADKLVTAGEELKNSLGSENDESQK